MPTVAEIMDGQKNAPSSGVGSSGVSREPVANVPLVIMIGADKGGVGKTMISRTMDDYLQRRRVNRKVFDAQYPGGDLKRFVPSASVVNMENVDDQMKTFDSVEGVSVVDIAAGGLSPTLAKLSRVGLLDEVREGKLALAVLHVLGQSVNSMEELGSTARALGTGCHYYPVKNLQTEFGFQEWEADPRYAQTLKEAEPITITVPHLADRVAIEVQKAGVSFDTFALDGHRSRMATGYVRAWLRDVCAEYDRVGLGKLIKGATNNG